MMAKGSSHLLDVHAAILYTINMVYATTSMLKHLFREYK